jgi:hypothetical protein
MKKLFLFLLLAIEPLYLNAAENEASECPHVSYNICKNLSVFGDLLYWNATQATSSSWANVVSSISDPDGFSDLFKAENIAFHWKYGYRAGASCALPYDQWDIKLYGTHFDTQGNSAISHGLIYTEFFGGFISGDVADIGTIRWNLSYTMFDAELGRQFCSGRCFRVRPFLGLKGGWIKQKIHSRWHVILKDSSIVNYDSTENLTNDFWGIGPSVGVNTE